MQGNPLERLKHHITGAIERGEKTAIISTPVSSARKAHLSRSLSLTKLRARQAAIVYESSEDEGAAEHYGEIQSVIDTITSEQSDEAVIQAAEWVGLDSDLVFT